MTMLAQPIYSPANQGMFQSLMKPYFLSIAILVLLCSSIFMNDTIQGELLIFAMLASLGSIQLATFSYAAQLADDLLVLAMAALGTIAMLYLLA
nr:hypothetical protein [uncultured Halomonas sp.]